MKKKRVDALLAEKGLVPSRETAKIKIMLGEVFVNGQLVEKVSQTVSPEALIEIRSKSLPYVSRGGQKLEGALKHFGVDPKDLICLDIGASTGGFTDCLLKKGAQKVYAVDVGHGQLDYSLQNHLQVVSLEKTNARYLSQEHFDKMSLNPKNVQLVVMDVSFISITKILPNLVSYLSKGCCLIILYKPQFEVDRKYNKDGLIISEEAIKESLENIQKFCQNLDLVVINTPLPSPIQGKKKKNQEYLICYEKA